MRGKKYRQIFEAFPSWLITAARIATAHPRAKQRQGDGQANIDLNAYRPNDPDREIQIKSRIHDC